MRIVVNRRGQVGRWGVLDGRGLGSNRSVELQRRKTPSAFAG